MTPEQLSSLDTTIVQPSLYLLHGESEPHIYHISNNSRMYMHNSARRRVSPCLLPAAPMRDGGLEFLRLPVKTILAGAGGKSAPLLLLLLENCLLPRATERERALSNCFGLLRRQCARSALWPTDCMHSREKPTAQEEEGGHVKETKGREACFDIVKSSSGI